MRQGEREKKTLTHIHRYINVCIKEEIDGLLFNISQMGNGDLYRNIIKNSFFLRENNGDINHEHHLN